MKAALWLLQIKNNCLPEEGRKKKNVCLQPSSDGLEANCDGLQPSSDGLQPSSVDACSSKFPDNKFFPPVPTNYVDHGLVSTRKSWIRGTPKQEGHQIVQFLQELSLIVYPDSVMCRLHAPCFNSSSANGSVTPSKGANQQFLHVPRVLVPIEAPKCTPKRTRRFQGGDHPLQMDQIHVHPSNVHMVSSNVPCLWKKPVAFTSCLSFNIKRSMML